jgi:hypothetical protein
MATVVPAVVPAVVPSTSSSSQLFNHSYIPELELFRAEILAIEPGDKEDHLGSM